MAVRRVTWMIPLMAPVMLAMLSACGESASGDGVGGVSASEARALNDAAEMLDNRTAGTGS